MNNKSARIKGVLFDLDGVFYVGEKLIPGGAETLDYLDQHRIPYRFITNTSTRSVADVSKKLSTLGLNISANQIFSAVSATRDFLIQRQAREVHLLLRDSVKTEFKAFQEADGQPDYIIVGDIGAAWTYELLNRVFNELMQGAELVAMHKNKYWQTEDGLRMDIGVFVAGLEYVSGKTATVIGKPSRDFFHLACEALELSANEVVVVGDDIENDIGGARSAGLHAILVRTGKYRESTVKASGIAPDAIIDSIRDLPGHQVFD